SPGMVHLRPHEAFPAEPGAATAPPPRVDEPDGISPHPLTRLPVEPLPLTAQPGEAAAPPRSDGQALPGSNIQRLQPRESPSAGLPEHRPGTLQAHASTAFAGLRGKQHLPARVGSAEQSNTSILYGKQLILKLFRRLQPGENPDVEIGRFLTEVAHFPRIAPFLGEISITPIDGEKTTVAMMQGLVANQGDGWEWFLNQLVSGLEQAVRLPRSKEYPTPRLLDDLPPLPEALALARESLEAAALLGQRTAEMHLALAMPT